MEFQPPKRGSRLIINVTSLIDVIFLLLIFFMVSSTFTQQPAVNIVLPRSVSAEETTLTPNVIYLTDTGKVFLNDREIPRQELDGVLADLHASQGEDRIILRADTNAAHGDVVSLIDLVKKNGFTRVSISARREQGP